MSLTDFYSQNSRRPLRKALVTIATLGAAVGFSLIPVDDQKEFRGIGYSLACAVEDRHKTRAIVAQHRRRGVANRRSCLSQQHG